MTVDQILQQYNLIGTGCRKMIISELLKSETALSEHEMKASCPDLFDRVTIYRTLRTLENSGAIHRITLHDNCVKYALSTDVTDESMTHSHFHCNACHKVVCLCMPEPLNVALPKGFTRNNAYIIVDGICAECNACN